MNGVIKNIYADKIANICFHSSLGGLVVSTIAILITYRSLPPFLPLYNKMAWGYQRIGHTYEIFLPITISFVFLFVNSYFGVKLQKKAPLLSRFLFLTTLSTSLFTMVFILKLLVVIL